jgi:aspartate/methionine/tyrosine aminotransferase
LPGSDFGSQGEGFVRIVYATSPDSIITAMRRIAEATKKL